jgi:signal transduction histidine kinase
VQTDEGRYIVLVVLRSERGGVIQRAALPLLYTLIVLLASTLAGVFLVWRFTQPIKNLADAARRVAHGDLSVRLTDAERTDEIGRLAARFNEMTANLEKTRQLEQQLQQAEKSAVVGRLGSAIAHEIRNPLNYINLTLDHLRAKFAPAEEPERETFERLTAQLKKEVGRINGQITDFLRYSRPVKLNLQPVNIRGVIEDSMRIVQAQAEEQSVTISIIEHENAPQVFGDVENLRSVFNNLFLNAVQAMCEGGALKVTISNAADAAQIEVADTGGGIAPENLDKIFEPYFSTKETGTGLGLAIVKKIVEDHNGTIEVASKVNEGTVFTVILPTVKK